MLLKNFSYGLVSLFLKSSSDDSLEYFKGTQGQSVGISNGTSKSRSYYMPVSSSTYNGASASITDGSARFGAAYGTGTTAPTIDDYQLSGTWLVNYSVQITILMPMLTE